MNLKPEHRDVQFAFRLAIASLRDYERCLREYGRDSEITATAWATYVSDERMWRETLQKYNGDNDE